MFDLTRVDWQFINTFAPWFSAIGTIAAVLLSLHLARGKTKVRLTVSVELKIVMEPTRNGYERGKDDYVAIEVVNIGETEATVTAIGWLGRPNWKRTAALQNLDDGIYAGSKLPLSLKFGQEARFMIRTRPHWLQQISQGMIGRFPFWSKLFVRCSIWTSVGQSFKVRPSRRILELLAQEAKAQRRAKVE